MRQHHRGAGARPHLGAVTAAAMLVEQGIEPILQLTCRDRNRIALAKRSDGRGGLGHPQPADAARRRPERRRPAGRQAGVRSRSALAARNRAAASRHRRIADRQQGHRPGRFFLGSADNPIDPPPGWEPTGLQAKIDAGAQFVQTQFCMDAGVVRRYMARLAEHGIDRQIVVPDRHRAAALGQVGALDQGETFRRRSFPMRSSRAWSARAIRRPKAAGSASRWCTSLPASPARRRRAHHGAGQRCRGARHHQGGTRERQAAGAV